MFLGAVLFFVSSILSGLAFGVWDLVLWRIMAGIGIGIASVIAPAYIAEIAPAAMRGRLGSLQQLAITLGIFAALLSDQLLATARGRRVRRRCGSGSRRGAGCSSSRSIPAAVYGILALRIPESPRYLVATGKREEAKEVLATTLPEDDDVEAHVVQIEHTIATDKKLASQASLRAAVRPAAGGVDRHPAVGVPAVRRHQRDLLLLDHAVAGRRLRARASRS